MSETEFIGIGLIKNDDDYTTVWNKYMHRLANRKSCDTPAGGDVHLSSLVDLMTKYESEHCEGFDPRFYRAVARELNTKNPTRYEIMQWFNSE